ncbi:MAG TPA: hypothetical protein VMD76_09130 [Candidatus Sulfotelmatobacter sp.]|nr:hypothetical protein [Candidatus Sulfotelmatobacter sp.]
MKARYYGYCALVPGNRMVITKWFVSPGDHIVLLEFIDKNGIRWLGPELPRDMAGVREMDVQTTTRRVIVRGVTIDAISGWTDFIVEEDV